MSQAIIDDIKRTGRILLEFEERKKNLQPVLEDHRGFIESLSRLDVHSSRDVLIDAREHATTFLQSLDQLFSFWKRHMSQCTKRMKRGQSPFLRDSPLPAGRSSTGIVRARLPQHCGDTAGEAVVHPTLERCAALCHKAVS